jgi:hypothetical protein
MIIGVMFPMPVLHIRMIASDLLRKLDLAWGLCASGKTGGRGAITQFSPQ